MDPWDGGTRPPLGGSTIDDQPSRVVVVTAPACHFCADARTSLAKLAGRYVLDVEFLDVDDPLGRQLIAEHRPPLFPLVLLDGAFFSAGRLPRRKLEHHLDRLGRPRRDGAVVPVRADRGA